jgi:hypothetical protein
MAANMYLTEIANSDVVEFPNDWFVINPESAAAAHSVHVVEVKHGARYNTPHFLYYSVHDALTSEEDVLVRKTAASMWPKLYHIIDMEVEPVYGEDGSIENLHEAANAPCVGVFKLPDLSDSPYEDYPFDAKVIRAPKAIGSGHE